MSEEIIEDLSEIGIDSEFSDSLDLVISNMQANIIKLSSSYDTEKIKDVSTIATTLDKIIKLKNAKDSGKSIIESFGLTEAPSKAVIDEKLHRFFTNFVESRDTDKHNMSINQAKTNARI